VNGFVNAENTEYDLVINGNVDGKYNKSAIILGNTTTYGRMMYDEEKKSSFIDVKGPADAKIVHRKHDGVAFRNILSMVLDNGSESSVVAADFDGRVQATQLVVQGNDARIPQSGKLNLSNNQGRGHFNVNKGSGIGGFSFKTYDNSNNLVATNMVLDQSGSVQMEYYKKTTDVNDSEDVAIAGLDASGTLVRNYEANERLRNNESRLRVVEEHLVGNGTLPSKVNEIVNRLNGLNFFSSNIALLATQGNNALPFGYIVNAPVFNTAQITNGRLDLAWSAPVASSQAPGEAGSYLITFTATSGSLSGASVSWSGMLSAGYPAVSQNLGIKNSIVVQSSPVLLGLLITAGVTVDITVSSLNHVVKQSNRF